MTTQRAVALAILVILLSTVIFAVVGAAAHWRNKSLIQLATLQGEHKRLVAAKHSLQTTLASLDFGGSDQVLWQANSTSQAEATIQSFLTSVGSNAGIQFRSISSLPGRSDNSAAFRMELEAPLDQLISFLRLLEYNIPAIPIDRAAIRRLTRPGAQWDFPVLIVQIDVFAQLNLQDGS